MPNNFRVTGTHYISKVGNDPNAGTDPNAPKATFDDYGTTTVVGSGVYKGAFALTVSNRTMKSDGYVVLDCTANFLFGITNEFNQEITGAVGFTKIRLNTFQLTVGGSALGKNRLTKVALENGTLLFSTFNAYATLTMTNCVMESIVQTAASVGRLEFDKGLIFNCTLKLKSANEYIRNSYVDAATTINMSAYFANPADFVNNCFMGKFNIGGTLYEAKKDKDGNAIDPNPAVNDLALIDATVYTRGNFSQDAEFQNIEKRDYFSVTNISPLLFGASDTTNIGGVRAAATFTTADAEISGGAIVDLELSSGDYIVDLPATSGQNTNTAMQIAPIPQVVENIDFATLLNFNSSQTIGGSENTMVPVVTNYAGGTAGANPRRLTAQFRWSTKDTIPVITADWDNNGFITAGDYATFELFKQPFIDVVGLGNGDPAFNPIGASPIKAKWLQPIQVITNGIG